MSLSIRWNRLDAPRWVGRLLVLQTVVSAGTTLTAFVGGLLWSAVVLLVVTFALGSLTSAWYAERPWAWHLLCAFQVLGLLGRLVGASGRSPLPTAVGLLLSLAGVALLLHPATRTRLDRPPGSRPAGAPRRRRRAADPAPGHPSRPGDTRPGEVVGRRVGRA